MAERKALWIHGDGVTPDYAGEDDRTLISAVFGAGRTDAAAAPGVGAIARGHGVIYGLDVTANGTPNNTVHIAAGVAVVRGTQVNDQGHYLLRNDADDTLTVSAADGANPRRDLVIAQVRDNEFPAFTEDDWVLDIVEGTPAGSPTDPTVPEDALVLARLLIDAGAGGETISSGDIVPLAPQVRAAGGITPVSSLAAFPSPAEGDAVFRTDVDRLAVHTGSVWRHKDLDYIARGSITSSPGGATFWDGTVVFPVVFASNPLVFFTPRAATAQPLLVVNTGTTATDVDFRLVTTGGGIVGSPAVDWCAIGPLEA